MKAYEDIIIKPYITEKSSSESAMGKYTFVVAYGATKIEIKHAVEKLFDVKVLSVNTMNYDGKKKRMGVHQGTRSKWKKAIVKIDVNAQAGSYLTKGGKSVASNKKYKTAIEEFGFVQ